MSGNAKRISFVLAVVMVCLAPMARVARAQDYKKEVDVLGFKFTLEDGTLEVQDEKLVLKGKGTLDLSPALGAGAVISVDEMSIDHDTTVKLRGITAPEIKIGPFSAKIAPDDIVMEKVVTQGIAADFNLNVILVFNIGGKEIQTKTTIPITKDGIKDGVIALVPPAGGDAFLKQDFNGAVLALNSGKVVFENKAFKSFSFSGSLNLFGVDFNLDSVTVTPDGISGAASAGTGTTLKMGNLGLQLKGGITFALNAEGFKVSAGETLLDLATMIPGADGKIIISSLDVSNGKLAAEGNVVQTVNIMGVSLSVEHFALNSEKDTSGKMLAKLSLDGALGIETPKLNLKFKGLQIDSNGNLSGDVTLPEPQTFNMFGGGVTISGVKFALADKVFTINASGDFNLGDDKLTFTSLTIAEGKINAEFDVSADKPFAFSWFKYLKVNQLKVEQNVLTIGGAIETPDPFKYTFAFQDVEFDPAGAIVKMKSATTNDVKTAAAGAAAKAWDAITDPDIIALENKSSTPIQVAGFSFYIDAIAIPNPLKIVRTKAVPDTLLKLYMRSEIPIGERKIDINVDGLEITKSGVKDLQLEVAPPPGQNNLFEAGFFNWAVLTVTKAVLVVKDNRLDSFGFQGGVTIEGKGFEVTSLLLSSNGEMEGNLKPVGDPYIGLGGIKILFQGDISFRVTGAAPGGGGGGGPPVEKSFAITFNKIALDMTDLIGTAARINADVLSIENGNIHAELATSNALDLFGIQMSLEKVVIDSLKPETEGGKRSFKALLTGSFIIPSPYIELAFKDFVISSTGEFGGDLSLSALQEVNLFGATFGISKITVRKLPNEPLSLAMNGYISFMADNRIEFTDLTIKGGKVSAKFGVSEEHPLAIPYCEFIKVTKLEIKDNALALSGYLQVPAPLDFRMDLKDLTIDSRGNLSGGTVSLSQEKIIDVGMFKLVIKSASFDLPTRYFKFSGEIRLPSDVIEQAFTFTDMGISLAAAGAGQLDTSRTQMPPSTARDKKHAVDLKISSVNFGQGDGNFFLSMTGQIGVSVGGYGFQLNFESLKIYQNITFSIGKVTGGIEIAGFKVYISRFEINDTAADPNFVISGGLSLPSIGSVAVDGLRIYKSGKIELEGIAVRVDYKAYVIEIAISYKDSVFKGDGKLIFAGKGIHVAAMFGPEKWSVDIDVSGLTVPLFPGIFLDSIGGGASYEYATKKLELRLRCGIAIGDKNMVYGQVELIADTTGVITIRGKLTALTMIPLAEAELVINIPQATVSGWANVNFLVGGIVLVNAKVNIYFSPSDWYVKATARADVLGVFNVGNAYFYLGSQGLEIQFWIGLNLSIVQGEASFYLKISKNFDIYARFQAYAEIDIVIVSVSGNVEVIYSSSSGIFDGKVGLEACVMFVCGSCSLHVWIDRSGIHANW